MSFLKALAPTEATANVATETDRIGGNGPVDSDAYLSTVTLAYGTKSTGGALGLVLHAKTEGGREIRQTVYMTSGTAKGGTNTYKDKDGELQFLPGYLQANALALLTVGKEIGLLDTEEKVVNVYDFKAKAEVPTKVPMVMDLLGKQIYLGVIKQVVDKNVKDASGAYVPNGETREENEIDKMFRAKDKLTVAEIRAEATEPAFFDAWVAKNKGQVRNRASKTAGVAGAPGQKAGAAPGTTKPSKSLFG